MKTKSLTQQSALFKVQLWHLRQQKTAERFARIAERYLKNYPGAHDYQIDLACSRRKAALHRKFVASITPFVLPL
jgi:hypothetical protein